MQSGNKRQKEAISIRWRISDFISERRFCFFPPLNYVMVNMLFTTNPTLLAITFDQWTKLYEHSPDQGRRLTVPLMHRAFR